MTRVAWVVRGMRVNLMVFLYLALLVRENSNLSVAYFELNLRHIYLFDMNYTLPYYFAKLT